MTKTLRTVGLNLLYLVPGETGGTETYARQLVPELVRARPDVEFVAFLNREAAAALPPELASGVELVPLGVNGRSRLRRTLAEQRLLPRAARSRGVDLLHSLATTAPRRPGVPSVVTVHDVIYALHPQAHTRAMRLGMRVLVPLAVRGADRVIAISHSSAAELSAELGVPADRIDVVHNGGRAIGPATPEPELRERLGLDAGAIVLSLSARRPHKNVARLLEAFASVEDRSAQLVLPGYATPFEDDLAQQARTLGIQDRVRFLGWVSDPDIEGLYRVARCFVFPSLAEGFGLPVLEAMQRGVPVACSRSSSIPEVSGDAARYFDATDVGDIAAAIGELLADRALRERLSQAGAERAKEFSWERAARGVIASYERALAAR